MKRRLLALLLTLGMVLALAACGGSNSDAGDAQTPPAQTPEEPANKGGENQEPLTAGPIGDRNGDGKITIACVHRNLMGATGMNIRAAYYYEAAQMDGVEIMFFNGNQDVQAQCDFIEDCLASKSADAFVVWTCDPDGIAGTVQAAHDQGYPVIVVDIALDCDQEALVTAGNYEMGVTVGEAAVEYLTEKNGSPSGKIYVITASSQATCRDRTSGFLSVIEQYDGIEIVDTYDMPTTTVDDGAALADDLLQINPAGSVDVYFCMSQPIMLGLVSAAATYNRNDFVLVGGFDHDDTFVQEMEKGSDSIIAFWAVQNAFRLGQEAFNLAVDAAKGEMPAEKEYFIEGDTVTQDTFAAYMEQYNFYQDQVSLYQ